MSPPSPPPRLQVGSSGEALEHKDYQSLSRLRETTKAHLLCSAVEMWGLLRQLMRTASEARGEIGAAAASLHHSRSNARSLTH